MAFIETTPPTEATGDVRAMYERQQGKYGYVPNYAKLFSHRPDIMALWADLLAGIRRHVEPRRFKLVTFVAALELRSASCALAFAQGLTSYYSEAEIAAIAADAEPSPLSAAEIAMVAFARLVARDATAVTETEVARLKERGFGDDEIFDIAATAAARSFFTKVLDGLGARPDTAAAYMALDESLRGILTSGGGRRPDRPAGDMLKEDAPCHARSSHC